MRQIVSALALLLIAAPAYAGMPQLEETQWYANSVLWLVVSFLALYLAVSRNIVPSIATVMHTREEAIDGAIREAERAKAEAESTHGMSASNSHLARAQAAEIIAKAQVEISREQADALHKLDRDLERRASQAAAVLDDAVAKATHNLSQAADDLAQVMVKKLVGAAAPAAAPKLKLAKS